MSFDSKNNLKLINLIAHRKSRFEDDDEDKENQSGDVADSEDNQSVAGSVENQSTSGSIASCRSRVIKEDVEEYSSDPDYIPTMEDVDDDDSNTNDDNSDIEEIRPKKKVKKENKFLHDINFVTKSLLFTILYVALNLDQSDIQLSHLFRFMKEGRLSIVNCRKFVPKEILMRSATHWKTFTATNEFTPSLIRAIGMTLFKRLGLGKPLVPDIRKIVNNFIRELCLPNDFKDLCLALIDYIPCSSSHFQINFRIHVNKKKVRIPDYETVIMSYIFVALKMCFGLDDVYEIECSDAIDKFNLENDYVKSHKLGGYSNETDRLFSFREWCNFLQFRKTMLCKFFLPMAQQHNLEIDNHIFMEHLPERLRRKLDLSDEITLDILNKIPLEDNAGVIPFAEFPPTLTPLSSYLEIILDYYQDPELKLLLSEDFTQYSLKYACLELKLPNENEMLKGVQDNNNKKMVSEVEHVIDYWKADTTLVYVRNCENKNWLNTKPPTINHVTKEKATEADDKSSDHGYDSNSEKGDKEVSIYGSEKSEETEHKRKLEYVKEEDPNINIFDDQFDDIEKKAFNELTAEATLSEESHREFENSTINLPDVQDDKNIIYDSKSDIHDNASEVRSFTSYRFDPATFDKDKTVKELILAACKKYKIPVPREYSHREPRKRKTPLINTETGCTESKKRRTKHGEAKKEIERILTAYYSNMERDVLDELAEHVKIVIQDLDTQDLDETAMNDDDGDTLVLKDLSSEQNLNNDSLGMEIDSQSGAATGKDNDNNSNPSENSVLETNIENTSISEDLLSKSDLKFDEKTHDIKQLYINFRDEFNIDDYLDNADSEIDEIITRNIENGTSVLYKEKSRLSDSDPEENISHFHLKEIITKKLKKVKKRRKWKTFVMNPKNVNKFYYWRRHYKNTRTRLNIGKKFELDVKKSLPKSFSFLFQECAAIANCSIYMLYVCMQALESLLL